VTLDFTDQVAIVTGAGGGLGRQHALSLAARGAAVVVNDLGASATGGRSPAMSVVEEIRAAGGRAVPCELSVTGVAAGAAIVEHAIDAFGRVDIVLNNAGIIRDKAFHNLSELDVRAVIDVHLFGAFWVTQPAYRLMRDQGYGRIVFTTSGAGLFGNFGQANYSAAKMGLVGLAKTIAIEGRSRGVRANVFAPIAATAMTKDVIGPLSDQLTPEAASPAAIYLCHSSCELSGQVLSSFGGRVAASFVGVTQGVLLADPSPEAVADSLKNVICRDGYLEPAEANDEVALYLQSQRHEPLEG
jgi:NAD(P)-dependent dehydrogenase (short-subunit alcohol dehydrogenase family)